MEKLKKALAQRCLATHKTPYYIDDCNRAKCGDRKILLEDIRPGQTIQMTGVFIPMEKVQSGSHNAFYEYEDSARDRQKMVVKDVLEQDGIIVIETSDAIYSNLDFSEPWKEIYEQELAKHHTKRINHAIEEAGRWFKNDTIALIKELGIEFEKPTKLSELRVQLERISQSLVKCAKEQGLVNCQEPYTKRQIDQFKSAAENEIKTIKQEKEEQRRAEITDKLYQIGKPILFTTSIGIEATNGKAMWSFSYFGGIQCYDKQMELPLVATIDGTMWPMTNESFWGTDNTTLKGMSIREIVPLGKNEFAIVTGNAVITNVNISQELKERFLSEGRDDLVMLGHLRVPEYLSIYANGPGLLTNLDIAYDRSELAKRCAENGIAVEQISHVYEMQIIDANGTRIPATPFDLYPEANIALTADFIDQRTGAMEQEKEMIFTAQSVLVRGGVMVIETGDRVLCNKDFSQELQIAENGIEIDNDIPTIGDNR